MPKIKVFFLAFIALLILGVSQTSADWLSIGTNSGNYFEVASVWPGNLKINEIMANPLGADSAPMPGGEWVEIYNMNAADIDLTGYSILDADSHYISITTANTLNASTIIPAHGFMVVFRNGAGGFSLNNNGDTVRLRDNLGSDIDSFTYGIATEGLSWSKLPDGIGIWQNDCPETPGTPNQ